MDVSCCPHGTAAWMCPAARMGQLHGVDGSWLDSVPSLTVETF